MGLRERFNLRFRRWPEEYDSSQRGIITLYNSGAEGAYHDPDAKQKLIDDIFADGGTPVATEVVDEWGFADLGEGKLNAPWVWIMQEWPGALPGVPQRGPDCVSKSDRNAKLGAWTLELVLGEPDEITGLVEGKPYVSPVGIKNGVLATEPGYAERGHRGGGANCATIASASRNKVGMILRQAYPEAGVDFTKYDYSWGASRGGRGVEDEVAEIGRKHLVRQMTIIEAWEEFRDMTAAGRFVHTCGGESWSNLRDANGVSERTRQGWAHALCGIGSDDRDIVRKLYGEPLVAVVNSWGVWNKGPRDVVDSAGLVPPHLRELWIELGIVNPETGNIMLPHGAWWCKWSTWQRRFMQVYSSTNGWPPLPLPTFQTGLG